LAGVLEASSRDFQWDMKDQGLDIVEGSAPSKMEKEIVHRLAAGNVGALVTQDKFGTTT
jgi:hypothetical protein